MTQVPNIIHAIQYQLLVNDSFGLKTNIKPRLINFINPHDGKRLLMMPKRHLAHKHSPFINQFIQQFGPVDALRIYRALELPHREHLIAGDVVGELKVVDLDLLCDD